MEDLDTWVAAARGGSGPAFEKIWTALAGPVAGYLRARGLPDPDDATSEVFLSAFRGLANFSGDGSAFRAWLFTIAHHQLIDVYRQRRPELRGVGFEAHEMVGSAEDAVVDDQELLDLLMQLPLPQREVVWLRVVLDLGVDEVCQITGRGPSAVKQLQRRGIDRLRRHLNGPTSFSPITATPVVSFRGVR